MIEIFFVRCVFSECTAQDHAVLPNDFVKISLSKKIFATFICTNTIFGKI